MLRFTQRLSLLAAVNALAALPAAAHDGHHGPDHNQIRGARVEVHGNVDRWGMFGTGGRFEFALAPDGFVGGRVHDELALSLGADLLFTQLAPDWYGNGAYVVPIAAVQWNFYLGPYWSVFPEVGLAFHMAFEDDEWPRGRALYAQPDLGFGARCHFTSRNALLMRVSTPGGVQIGLTF